jgi:hypothetical protein
MQFSLLLALTPFATPPYSCDMRKSKGTTIPGFENKNGQVVLQRTSRKGTDHLQYVYILRCKHCGGEYGANGSDIWLRKCPTPKSKCVAGGGRNGIA